MSLSLYGHHVLLIATLAFITAILTPNWYKNPEQGVDINIFQLCRNSSSQTCQCIFFSKLNNETIQTTYLIIIASLAIACIGISIIGLLLSSWYIERYKSDNSSKWLLILTMLSILFSFLLSGGVWTMILTTNFQQEVFKRFYIRLQDFGFSFWINIASSSIYLSALVIYLIAICRS